MLADKNTIERYIPQRSPMVMIHDLLSVDETQVVTRLKVSSENIFVSGGFLTEPGLVENIAQTAAAQVGYQCAQKNAPVPVGYIAAIKGLAITSLPPVDHVIKTSVRIINQVLDVTIIEGNVEYNNKMICTCEMRIFIKP